MKKLVYFLFTAVVFLSLTSSINAQKAPKDAKVKMCVSCHKADKNKPAEFKAWLMSTHSNVTKAFEKPEAKDIASKNNIENAATSETCLKCHVNKFEAPEVVPQDIDCMSCHSPESTIHPVPEKVTHPSVAEGGQK